MNLAPRRASAHFCPHLREIVARRLAPVAAALIVACVFAGLAAPATLAADTATTSAAAWSGIVDASDSAQQSLATDDSTTVAPTLSGGRSIVFGDPSAAPADGVRFAAERPVPIQHQLPSAADPWGRIEYVDGFIHYRLVGRGDVVDSAADGSTVGMSLADGRTQVVVGDTWGSEEWVIDPNGGDSWQSTLSWQIEVPSGWSVSLADHVGAGDELFIQDSDGWNRVTVKAPSYTDETGAEHPLNMTWDANTATMSVIATPILDGAVGSIAVDPVWVNDAAAGQFEYQICPGTTKGLSEIWIL